MTKLLYMDDFDVVSCEATVIKVEEFKGKTIVVLDQTCFYAKGGGQDYDMGVITSEDARFIVEEVYFIDDEVKHVGSFESGALAAGSKVSCEVDQERRTLNSRLHSGGHVIDLAVRQLEYGWVPGKGAHYPHMAFVDYTGDFDAENKQTYIDALQAKIDELIKTGSTNTIKFMPPEEMKQLGAVVPENMPAGKPARVVLYDDFAVPCGGTHVRNITDIGALKITNIRNKRGVIHVSYEVR